MTNRELLLQELADYPDELLTQAVEFLRSKKTQTQPDQILGLQPSPAKVWASVMQQIQNLDPLEQERRNQALSDLLQSWEEEDAQEQKETWEFLQQALNEDRLSNRPRV